MAPILPIRFETLAPDADRYPTHLYVADDRCFRCNQVTPVLRIEVAYPDVDTAGRDVDTTTQFCPTCLEQLAREVREKIPELVGRAPPVPTCTQHVKGGAVCGAAAAFRFTWPGEKERCACHAHATSARYIAESMGFELELTKLDPAVVDLRTDLPASLLLEEESEVRAYDELRPILVHFKRALDQVEPIMRALGADGPRRRVLIAALTAVGFAPEFVALFTLGIDIGAPFPPPTTERH